MNASAHITYDRPYFEAFYSDWIRYRSKWRRFAIPTAFIVTALGCASLYWMPEHTFFGLCLLVYGVCQVCESTTYRRRWIDTRIKDLRADKTADFAFRGEEITYKTPNSTGQFNVAALADVIATPNGMFLLPQSGFSIFIPRESLEPPDILEPLADSLIGAIDQHRQG